MQLNAQNSNINENIIDKKVIIDSLIQKIYRDTISFDEKDLIFTQIGRRNVNSYSMLYVVNENYLYMLDIIPSCKVIEFVNEYLNINKIADITIIAGEKAIMFYGVRGQNGVVLIRMNRRTKFNPKVAGLEKTGRRIGDNFTNRKTDELKIRE